MGKVKPGELATLKNGQVCSPIRLTLGALAACFHWLLLVVLGMVSTKKKNS